MNEGNLIALHGFLGRPSDWDALGFESLQAPDLFSACDWRTFEEWTDAFTSSINKQSILMGYSLGGRLALHALTRQPSLWQAGIIVSAHPGLTNPTEKKRRLKQDAEWAHRFITEEWDALMNAWNGREVFAQGQFTFKRLEKDYQRKHLAHFLQQASLGNQEDLRLSIYQLSIPILWMVGEKDQTYCQLAQSIKFSHPHSKLIVIPDSGHRVPWEQPILFKNYVEQFLRHNSFGYHFKSTLGHKKFPSFLKS